MPYELDDFDRALLARLRPLEAGRDLADLVDVEHEDIEDGLRLLLKLLPEFSDRLWSAQKEAEAQQLRVSLALATNALDYLYRIPPAQLPDIREQVENYRWLRRRLSLDLIRGLAAESAKWGDLDKQTDPVDEAESKKIDAAIRAARIDCL